LKSFLSLSFNTIRRATATISSKQKLKDLAATSLYRNAVYLILNTAITSLLGFFFWMIVARYYSEAEVGYSSAIISAISLLVVISLAGLNSSIIRFLPRAEKPRELINSCLTFSGLASVIIATIFVMGIDFWSPALVFIKENIVFTLAFIIFTSVRTISTLVNDTFVASRKANFVLFKSAIFSIVKLPLPVLLVSFFLSFGVVASWGIAAIVALAFSLFLLLPRVQANYKPIPALNTGMIKELWRYSSISYVANLLSSSLGLILPLLVVNVLDSSQNAFFYVAWMLSSLLFAIPHAVSHSLFAEGSHFEDRLRENVLKSLKFIFLLLVPSIIVLVLAGKWLLLAFGQSYSLNALKLLWILSISSLPVAFTSLYTTILRVKNRLKELIILWACIVFIVLVVGYLTMPDIGIEGVGYAWLGTHILVSIYIFASKKLLPKK